jgi:hypothetical protein
MLLSELIERLVEYQESLGEDVEVRLMTQPNWPFECSVGGVVSAEEVNSAGDGDDDDVESEAVVYLLEGQQLGYGSKRAWAVS